MYSNLYGHGQRGLADFANRWNSRYGVGQRPAPRNPSSVNVNAGNVAGLSSMLQGMRGGYQNPTMRGIGHRMGHAFNAQNRGHTLGQMEALRSAKSMRPVFYGGGPNPAPQPGNSWSAYAQPRPGPIGPPSIEPPAGQDSASWSNANGARPGGPPMIGPPTVDPYQDRETKPNIIGPPISSPTLSGNRPVYTTNAMYSRR